MTVPAGSLAAPTVITLRLVGDDTSLPPLAVRVGQTYAIEPTGLALAAPASLTLPVIADEVSGFGETASDCKVWSRAGDGWQLVEPTAAAGDSVTVPVSTTGSLDVVTIGGRLLGVRRNGQT